MKFRYLIVIFIISSFLLISSVSAEDLNATVSSNQISDCGVLKNIDSSGSFTDLANRINESEGEVNLDKDYVFDPDKDSPYINGINITKEIRINGNGFSLNGKDVARAFDIKSQNVMLTDILFINNHAYFDGIISWNGNNGSIINCNFKNNSVSSFGVVQWSGNNGKIVNSNFIDNSASGYGVVYWIGNCGTILNCSFIDNCDFNKAYVSAHVVLDYIPNCYEVNPYSNPTIRDMYFFKGGAVFWKGNNGMIENSNFVNNSAYEGGAIYLSGCNASINNCSFFTNKAVNVGGDIYLSNVTENSSIRDVLLVNSSDCIFPSFDSSCAYENVLIVNNESIAYISNNSNITFANLEDLKGSNQIPEYLICKLFSSKENISKPIVSKVTGAKNIIKYYKSPVSYTVRVYDDDSFATGKSVKFTINKKTYNIAVDKKGFATLKLNQKPGKYTLYVSYNNIKFKNIITVKSTLITKNLKTKVKKSAKFTVKVLNSKGKVYAKQVVNVKFKGKTYKIKTDKKGIVTFNVPKNLKVGKYTIKTTYNGLTNSNKIIVKK